MNEFLITTSYITPAYIYRLPLYDSSAVMLMLMLMWCWCDVMVWAEGGRLGVGLWRLYLVAEVNMKSDEGGGVRAKYQSPNFLTDMIHNSILEEIHHTCLLITLPTHTHTHTHTHAPVSLQTLVLCLAFCWTSFGNTHARTTHAQRK